jgi:hypothetical protein
MQTGSRAISGKSAQRRSEMAFFRRKPDETLNEQMLREAGLDSDGDAAATEEHGAEPAEDADPPDPIDPLAGSYPADPAFVGQWPDYLGRAMARPAVWDLVTSVTAPGIAGDQVEFATLASGDMIVDTETGEGDLSPLADAVEKELAPPYRVLGRRQEDDVWGIAARTIDVVELKFDGGDEIELVENEGVTDLRVDGKPWKQVIPELERAGETLGSDFVVQADRLDGDFWEIRASAL